MLQLLFLDIDGVLNDHVRLPNGVCGLKASCVAELNRILDACPDVQIVVSSAWRYYIHNGHCTPEGFNMLLQTHGLKCWGRIHGVTDADAEVFRAEDHAPPYDEAYWYQRGLKWRVSQIEDYCDRHGQCRRVVLDDLPLAISELVQTEKTIGLTADLADEVIRRFTERRAPG